jgi:uncharacterized membrane protein
MTRVRNSIFNICFAINCLLVFFLFVENRLQIPGWLQVAGRMHPLVIHFPITLLIIYIVWALFVEKRYGTNEPVKNIGDWILLWSAFTASLAALAGILLSKEDGYDKEALQWHKWGGIAISIIASCWYAYRNSIAKQQWLKYATALITLGIVIFTGHQGSVITHGQNFLLAPLTPEKKQPKVLLEEAGVYTDMVRPILQSKCISCHNSKKAKGQLVMETEELLIKGGKHGKLWDSTANAYGLLLSRVHMPVDAEKHMPPDGKPQLSEQDIRILYLWIKMGAPFKTRVMALAETDTLRLIANTLFNTIETDDYNFAAATDKEIKELNSNYRVLAPLAKESPALSAAFFSASSYLPAQLKELLAVKTQVVDLNLNKMPVKDDELATISQFSNLRKLNLSFTGITGSTLQELNKLNELRQLSLSGTTVKKENVLALSSLKKLSHLFIWNTTLSETEIGQLKKALKDIVVETGFTDDTSILKLTKPILVNEEQIITSPLAIRLKHYIKGVAIRYTLDGTEPDSIQSLVYNNDLVLAKNVMLKAKAFKQGWISSAVLENYFFSSTWQPDSSIDLLPPDEQYKGTGAKTLTDLVKGEPANYRNGKWLGFRNNKMESMLVFLKPVTASGVTLSALVDIGSYIMPPFSIEVWGGDDPAHLKRLSRITPQQPAKIQPAYIKGYELPFAPVSLKFIKIIAVPVPKLPAWHPGKGDKGWILTDEVFVN